MLNVEQLPSLRNILEKFLRLALIRMRRQLVVQILREIANERDSYPDNLLRVQLGKRTEEFHWTLQA